MKNKQKIIWMLTAWCITGTVIHAVPAQAEDTQKVVVIGDSISSGAGLAEGEKSYVDWIAYYTDVQIQNFAQDNYTTADVLTCLDDPQIQKALAEADIILVTAGIHDIMDPFLEVADSYMKEFGFVRFSDVFFASLEEHGISSEEELLPYSNNLTAAARSNRDSASANMKAITEKLAQYQNAEIVYQTVYNAIDTIENIDTLSSKRQKAYKSICNPVASVMKNAFNTYLLDLETQGKCMTADIFTGFKGYAYRYTRLNDLEATPSAEGHWFIAEAVMEKAGLEKKDIPEPSTETTVSETTTVFMTTTTTVSTTVTTATSVSMTSSVTESTTTTTETKAIGDLTQDNLVNAADAADVLKAAANIGAGKPSGLSPELEQAADINQDKQIDSADAALILSYAAQKGSGKISIGFSDYLKTL